MTEFDTAVYETLKLSHPADQTLLISLNRPDVANAVNTLMGEELLAVFTALARSAAPPRAIILTGAGERHFCAGGDLKERQGMSDDAFFEQHRVFERMILAVMDCPVPVIAAVNGAAFGGGCELVLACDFAYASEGVRFALTETSLGIMPGCGGTQNLVRAAGLRRAKELVLTASPFSADEAFAWGVVNRVCRDQPVLKVATLAAQSIAANGPLAVRQAKRAMDYGSRVDLRTALFMEVDAYNRLVTSADRQEGISAFNDKRKPVFVGR